MKEQQDPDITQLSENTIVFMIANNGAPVKVTAVMNYPFYDITLSDGQQAQLRQDQHSNWFKTNGHLDDSVVQQIGRKISYHITGVWPTNI